MVKESELRHGSEVFGQQPDAVTGRPDQSDTLAPIKAPCLLMCGREDRLCAVQWRQEIAGLVSHAKLEVIREAGHLSALEQLDAANWDLQRRKERQ